MDVIGKIENAVVAIWIMAFLNFAYEGYAIIVVYLILKGRIHMGNQYIGYAGTYTRKTSEGVYRFVLDTEAGTIGAVEVAAKVGSPTYLAINEDDRYLYAVAQDGDLGGVAAYEINGETGELSALNEQLEAGAPPCHLEIRGNELVTGNYHQGTIDLLKIDEQGRIASKSSSVQHEGTGPHDRQEKPHVHYTAHTPDGKYVVVADLGTDKLVTYKISNDELENVSTFHSKAGSGPRHIVFHPNGKTAYLLTELSTDVVVLTYDSDQGSFTEKQSIRAIPADFTETNDAGAIHISADGKYLYTSNRGHNSITVFAISEDSNELTHVEYVPTGGEWPRDFSLDPSGAFLIVANQHTGNLVLFSRDEGTGKLTNLHSEIAVPEAVCVKFLGNK